MSRRARKAPSRGDSLELAQPQVLGQSASSSQPALGTGEAGPQQTPPRIQQEQAPAAPVDARQQSYPSTQYQAPIGHGYRPLQIDPADLKPELTVTVESASRGRVAQSRQMPPEVFVQTQASLSRHFRRVKVEQAHQFGVNTADNEQQCHSPQRRHAPKTHEDTGVLLQLPALRAVTLDWQANSLQLENQEDAEVFDLLVTSNRVQSSLDLFFLFFESLLFACGFALLCIFIYAPDDGSADIYIHKTVGVEPLLSRGTLCLSEVSLVATSVRLKKVMEHVGSFDHSFRSGAPANQTHRPVIQQQLGVVWVAFFAYIFTVACCMVTTRDDWSLSICNTCTTLEETPLADGNAFSTHKGFVVTKAVCAMIGSACSVYDMQCESAFRFSRLPDKSFGEGDELT